MPLITVAMALAQYAPSLIKWLTGSDQAESVATTAVEIAKSITGAPSGEAALETLRANQEAALAFQTKVLEQEANFEQMYLADRQDARKRDVELVRAGRYNARADILAFLAVAGLILCVYFIARDINIPERAVNAIMFIAGILASAVKDVYGFEFGSSKGSHEANGAIRDLLKYKGM